MFSFFRPNRSDIESFISRSAAQTFSYRDVGGTAKERPQNGYTVDHNRIKLGSGTKVWDRAKPAVIGWKMFDFPWVSLCWPAAPIRPGENVAILVRHLGFFSLNAARIVYTIDEPDRFGFAYGTLSDHGESGEERFLVERDPELGDVWYDLYAFSKPNYLLAKMGYPLTRHLQRRFAMDSKQAMSNAVRLD